MFSKKYIAFQLIRKGYFMVFLKKFKKRIFSRTVSFGLQRDMNEEFRASSAKIEIQIRPLRQENVSELLHTTRNTSINSRLIAHQQSMVNAYITICYVAVTTNKKPYFMQGLIGYKDNENLEKYNPGIFAPFNNEALLEGAYCNPDNRGMGFMPEAISLIVAEKAPEMDARWVNTFEGVDNILSLKGCYRLGFKPYLIRRDQWFLFHRIITFLSVSDFMNEIFTKSLMRTDIKPETAIKY